MLGDPHKKLVSRALAVRGCRDTPSREGLVPGHRPGELVLGWNPSLSCCRGLAVGLHSSARGSGVLGVCVQGLGSGSVCARACVGVCTPAKCRGPVNTLSMRGSVTRGTAEVPCGTGTLTHATPGWVPEPEHPLRGHAKAKRCLSQPRTQLGASVLLFSGGGKGDVHPDWPGWGPPALQCGFWIRTAPWKPPNPGLHALYPHLVETVLVLWGWAGLQRPGSPAATSS